MRRRPGPRVALAIAVALAAARGGPAPQPGPPAGGDDAGPTLWSEIARPDRDRVEPLITRADALVDRQPREAAALLEQALALEPDRPQALYLLGRARSLERSWGRCADALERLRRVAPGFALPSEDDGRPPTRVDDLLGLCLALAGRYDAAVAHYRRLLLAPSGGGLETLHGNLADCYLALGRIDEAIVEYLAAIALAPRRALFHFGLAVAYDRDGRPSRAVDAMLRGLALDGTLAELASPQTYFVPPEDEYYTLGLAHQVAAESDPPRRLAAVAQFRKYLAAVPAGPWSARAREHLAELGSPSLAARDVAVHPQDGAEADELAHRAAQMAPELQRCLEDAGAPHAVMRVSLSFVPAEPGGAAPPARARSRPRATAPRRARVGPGISWSSQGPDGVPPQAAECVEKRLQTLTFAPGRFTRVTLAVIAR